MTATAIQVAPSRSRLDIDASEEFAQVDPIIVCWQTDSG